MSNLTDEERKDLSTHLPKTSWPPLSLSIVRLYFSKVEESNPGEWFYSGYYGILLLIVDRVHDKKPRRLQLWTTNNNNEKFINNPTLIFQQELYYNMKYEQLSPDMHAFEIQNPMGIAPGISILAGFNFCDINDANNFYSKVLSNIPVIIKSNTPAKTEKSFFSRLVDSTSKVFGSFLHDDDVDDSCKISGPTNFQHVQHIGYDPDNGFDVKNMSADMINIFKAAGVKKKDLTNPETAKIIYQQVQDSIQVQDSMSSIQSVVMNGQKRNSQSRASITASNSDREHGFSNSSQGGNGLRINSNSFSNSNFNHTLPANMSVIPPPIREISTPTSNPPTLTSKMVAPPFGKPNAPPVPPPPKVVVVPNITIIGPTTGVISNGPPIAVISNAPVVIPTLSTSSTSSAPLPDRSNLLLSIQQGAKLRPVSTDSTTPDSSIGVGSSALGAFNINAVKDGSSRLKKVEHIELPQKIDPKQANDLVSRLASAMANRRGNMKDDDATDDDDWD